MRQTLVLLLTVMEMVHAHAFLFPGPSSFAGDRIVLLRLEPWEFAAATNRGLAMISVLI